MSNKEGNNFSHLFCPQKTAFPPSGKGYREEPLIGWLYFRRTIGHNLHV